MNSVRQNAVLLTDPIVALFFKAQRKFGFTRFNDASSVHDVNEVRIDVI